MRRFQVGQAAQGTAGSALRAALVSQPGQRMELLAAYGDEDDGPIVPLQPKLISKSLELAPYVNPDQSERRLQYVNPHTKELAYNPRVDAMLAPIQGPVDPNARKTLAAEMNTPTGYIEAANLNPTVFNDQFHMFASRKFAHDPAGPAQIDGKPVLIGNVDNASKPDRVEEKERHAFMKQKRKQQGQVDNTTEFLGPWAPYEVKQLPPIKYPGYVEGTEGPQPEGAEAPVSGPEVAPKVARVEKEKGEEEEEEAEGAAAKPAANRFEPAEERRARERDEAKAKSEYARSEREKQLAIQEDIGAKTMLHIPDVRDYLGRTFMSPPSDLKNRPHDCYVPKKVVHTFSGHTKGISSIKFFPKFGHLLLSGSMDNQVILWDVYNNNRGRIRTYVGHTKGVRTVDFNHDGTRFLTCSFDRTTKLWDTETGKCVHTFITGKLPYVAKFCPDPAHGNDILVGQNDKKIIQWDTNTAQITQEYDQHLGPINTITFVDGNRRFVTTSDDKAIRIWEYGIPVTVKLIAEPHMHSIPYVYPTPDGEWILGQSLDNQILTYAAKDRFKLNKKKRFAGHVNAGHACGISMSPDMRYVLSGDVDGQWDRSRVVKTLRAHKGVLIDLAWHPIEPSRVATAGWDGKILLWD